MFFQMQFKFSKKFRTVYDLHKISRFFNWLLCFSSRSLYPESVTAAMFTFPKKLGST